MRLLLLLGIIIYVTVADETPGFFIKLSKSVPRIGRRGDFENFFLKQSKSVPRIGRRGGYFATSNNWFDRLMSPAKRPLMTEDSESDVNRGVYNKVRPLDLHHIIDILSDDLFFGSDLKFISWDVLDKALEEDPELLGKLSALARDKEVHQLKQLLTDNKDELIQYVPLEGTGGGQPANIHSSKAYIYRTDRDPQDQQQQQHQQQLGHQQNSAQLSKEKVEYQQ
ncbi:uncharacterized protein LOC129757192 [Uranotaenia lowii]|uniref:uncharacterized protein LOC129757192 n=1 Tax=Uranotaenia lowii TaxID=190385 RepID=UPI002479CEA2|nr:uncharacterized protein LOC129757192 [Uranotaenia lowii]